jgi:Fe-S-cluster containining protein
MNLSLEELIAQIDIDFFLKRLSAIYSSMDLKYSQTAAYYGFNCTGCEDNCCQTRFYHHTVLEYLYIIKEFNNLEPGKQIEIKARAREVRQKSIEADRKGKPVRQMCPLNSNGKCILYSSRPMICRLHGIPHELHNPGRNITYGSGCEAFSKQFGGKDYYRFDRTPFYMQMASLEKELKQAAGITTKVKMTIADMLIPESCMKMDDRLFL